MVTTDTIVFFCVCCTRLFQPRDPRTGGQVESGLHQQGEGSAAVGEGGHQRTGKGHSLGVLVLCCVVVAGMPVNIQSLTSWLLLLLWHLAVTAWRYGIRRDTVDKINRALGWFACIIYYSRDFTNMQE